MDGIQFRRASVEDYDGIMSIRKGIYRGMDYLPVLFMDMMKTHIGYVGVYKDQIVAFECIAFVDGGTTIVLRALRVRKDMEGKGLTSKMKEFIENDQKHNLNIKRRAYAFAEPALLKKVADGKAELVLKQERIDFLVSLKSSLPTGLMRLQRSPCIKRLEKADLRSIFRSNIETGKLFPDDRIIVNWVPYRLLDSNVEIFCDDSTLILSSSTDMKTCGKDLMTLGYGYSADVGIVYNLEIFGILTEEYFIYHLEEHIRHCSRFQSDSALFMFHYQSSKHDDEIISSTMKQYDATDVTVSEDKYLYFVEDAFK